MKSIWTTLALIIGLSSLGGFTYVMSTGTEVGAPQATFVPKEVRTRPGGYRSFHFWHIGYGGYRGGK